MEAFSSASIEDVLEETTLYSPSRPYALSTLSLRVPIIPALDSMPMILPLNFFPWPLRSASESMPLTYEGTVSSSEVGPYHEPRSVRLSLYRFQ